MTYSVRHAAPADLAGVVRVLARAAGEVPVSETQQAMWARMLATDDLTVFVAEGDGEVVGTTSLLVLPNLTYDCRPTAFSSRCWWPPATAGGASGACSSRPCWPAPGLPAAGRCRSSPTRHTDDGAYDFYRALGFEGEGTGFRLYLR